MQMLGARGSEFPFVSKPPNGGDRDLINSMRVTRRGLLSPRWGFGLSRETLIHGLTHRG
jgi:hypothetical protein